MCFGWDQTALASSVNNLNDNFEEDALRKADLGMLTAISLGKSISALFENKV